MAHVDPAPVRAAPGLPGGALDDRDMDDRERSGAIVERGLGAVSFLLPLNGAKGKKQQLESP